MKFSKDCIARMFFLTEVNILQVLNISRFSCLYGIDLVGFAFRTDHIGIFISPLDGDLD